VGLTPLDPEAMRASLTPWLAATLGAGRAEVIALERMGGGAIQENWYLDVRLEGGPRAGEHALVLRTTALAGVPVSLDRVQEYRVIEVAHEAGVLAPEPLGLCEDPGVIGRPFYLMRRLPGRAAGHQLTRDPEVEAWGDTVLLELGRQLARLHRVTPPEPRLDFLEVPDDPVAARIALLRDHLDRLGAHEPTLELGLRWLELNRPEPLGVVLCHGDYRTGNYLVHEGRLTAILDWEFACWSDPLEDLGWLCARCWRFGQWEREAGGIGRREALYRGYEAVSGRRLPREHVPWWEVLGTLRWAVIALQQAERHLSGREPSLELALTGHRVPELELDVLQQIRAIEQAAEPPA
jgi:aminoglycoside phosphotransferase (APT) family kinase protein